VNMVYKEISKDVEQLFARGREGDLFSIGRLISYVDHDDDRRRQVIRLAEENERPYVVGITGAPGAGKSTLISGLVKKIRETHVKIGILAVDPSSPITGGALLGDRLRFKELNDDDHVFVRSLASRGRAGGLAALTPDATRVLGAVGYGVVIVETVGTGQVDCDIARFADTSILVMAPGWGDRVQALKAGVLEVVDIIVVNKGDIDGADELEADLKEIMRLRNLDRVRWRAPVIRTSAKDGLGIESLVDAIEAHRAWRQEREVDEHQRKRRWWDIEEGLMRYLEEVAYELRNTDVYKNSERMFTEGSLERHEAVALLLREYRKIVISRSDESG